MARRVATYLGAHLDRRHRCPDCGFYIVAIDNVECCPECGQILGPSMRFEHSFLPVRSAVDTPTRSVAPSPATGRETIEQGALF